jgi:hypothetical protein
LKNLLFIITVSFLTLFSCSSGSDDNKNTEDNSLLLRKWYNLEDISGLAQDCGKPAEYFEFSEPNIHEHVVIGNDGCNYILTDYGTWTMDGNTIVITYNQSLSIAPSIITIEELSLTTFSFLVTGGLGAEGNTPSYYVLSSY